MAAGECWYATGELTWRERSQTFEGDVESIDVGGSTPSQEFVGVGAQAYMLDSVCKATQG